MATRKPTKTTIAKAAEPKAAPAKKATAAKGARVAKKAKPAEPAVTRMKPRLPLQESRSVVAMIFVPIASVGRVVICSNSINYMRKSFFSTPLPGNPENF